MVSIEHKFSNEEPVYIDTDSIIYADLPSNYPTIIHEPIRNRGGLVCETCKKLLRTEKTFLKIGEIIL